MRAINWWLLDQRKPPTAPDIKKAVKDANELPDDGDAGHVAPPWDVYSDPLPVIEGDDWNAAEQKQVKIKKLVASTVRLDRRSLVWHIEHPGQSKYRGKFNTHPQVFESNDGDLVIIDGHHRLAALLMLGVKKDTAWILREKDLPND